MAVEYPDHGLPLEVRWDKSDPEGRTFTATVCNYNTPDSKGTTFAPGAFTRSLESKLPKAVWSHDWSRPIGQVVAYRDSAEKLDVDVKLADFGRVKDADMAHSLLDDGIIDEFSFGFSRSADQPDPNHKGVTMITEASIKEVSPVLVGSVPGTRTLAVRADDGTVDVIEEPANDELRSLFEEFLETRVGPHGYSHGWVKAGGAGAHGGKELHNASDKDLAEQAKGKGQDAKDAKTEIARRSYVNSSPGRKALDDHTKKYLETHHADGTRRNAGALETRDALTRAADLIESGDTDEAAGLLQLTVDQLLTDTEPTEDELAERAELETEIRSDLDRIEGVLGGPF